MNISSSMVPWHSSSQRYRQRFSWVCPIGRLIPFRKRSKSINSISSRQFMSTARKHSSSDNPMREKISCFRFWILPGDWWLERSDPKRFVSLGVRIYWWSFEFIWGFGIVIGILSMKILRPFFFFFYIKGIICILMGYYRCTLEVCHGYIRFTLIAFKIIVYKYKPLLSHSDTPSILC